MLHKTEFTKRTLKKPTGFILVAYLLRRSYGALCSRYAQERSRKAHALSAEQIVQNRKSNRDTTLKHPADFQNKQSLLTPDNILLHKQNVIISTRAKDRRFSLAASDRAIL